jgi:hypothetical protein
MVGPNTGRKIDNLHAELDWAFSPDGEASIAANLTASAVPLRMHLSLMEECSGRVERALSALGAGANRDARHEMQLHAALVTSRILTGGADTPEVGAAWTKAPGIADSLDDAEYQSRVLWGLWSFHIDSGQGGGALDEPEVSPLLCGRRSVHW